MSEIPAFTVGDVFLDAFGSLRRRAGLYIGFNALFVGLVFILCCAVILMIASAVGVLFGARSAPAPFTGFGAPEAVLTGIYVVALLLFAGMAALHQGFVLASGVDDIRGEPVGFSLGLASASRRFSAQMGCVLLRALADAFFGCLVFGLVLALVYADMSASPVDDPSERAAELEIASTLAMLATLPASFVWIVATRAFVGLGPALVQHEARGPLAAMSRSASLLRGHRGQLVGMRVLWGALSIAIYVALCIPIVSIAPLMDGDASAGPDVGASLFLLFYMFVIYGVIVLLYTFDTLLEAAFYGRMTAGRSPSELAEVFG